MTNAEAAQQIEQLTQKINHYNTQYYLNDVSEVSDYEFDRLLAKLSRLEKAYPALVLPDSPSRRVGGEVTKKFPSVRHQYPMLSLENSYDEDDLYAFENRIKKTLGEAEEELAYFCEQKFDGVAISLRYEAGYLKQAVTRGDGKQGDDITANVRTIRMLPLRVKGADVPKLFEVRGEIFFSKKRFGVLNQKIAAKNVQRREAQKKEVPLLANARNAASGTLKMQNSAAVAQRGLSCYVYALLSEEMHFKTQEEAVSRLLAWGFPVSPTYARCLGMGQVWQFINRWEKKRFSLPLETDGIVVKLNDKAAQKKLGYTAKSPRWAIAFKYKTTRVSTLLEGVDFQLGRTGAVTPVAKLRPVLLSGTTVRRASLHNANEIARLDLHEADWVFVEKGGEIIPKIVGVDVEKRKKDAVKITFPTHCPACGSLLLCPEGEAARYCENTKNCPPQIKEKLKHFISRKALNVETLGPETLAQCIKKGFLHTPADLYTLTAAQLTLLERGGKKSAQNILDGLEKSKQVPFARLLFGLGIRFVGRSVAEKLAEHFGSIDRLMDAQIEELTAVAEIGTRIAESLNTYFAEAENQTQLRRLKEAGLQMQQKTSKIPEKTARLGGKTFVVSGVFEHFSREALKAQIVAQGGKNLSAVSGKLDYLLAGKKAGASKLKQANALGIAVISEKDFLAMLKN